MSLFSTNRLLKKTKLDCRRSTYIFFWFHVDSYDWFCFSLPEWAEFVVKSNGILEYFSSIAMMAATHSTETKKIRSGFLLKEMLDRFKEKILSSSEQLLYIYSAHDNVIINFLNSLNVYEVSKFLDDKFYAINCIIFWMSRFSYIYHPMDLVFISSCIGVVRNTMCNYFTGGIKPTMFHR